jgi:predicted Zn-dependent peptidase
LGGPGSRYANLWGVQAYPLAPHTTSEVEQAIYAEFERLMREPVPERELQKVKNQLDADFVRGLSSNRGLASQLTYYEAVVGDWRYLTRWREMIAQITPEDLQRVARRYLVPENRTVATLVRKESAGQ